MSDIPEILREYRVKIVPADKAEPGQIDSFEFNGKDNPNRKDHGDTQFMFGDVGMIYVWFCFDCLEPLATMDCY
jgi:hypothetical protein